MDMEVRKGKWSHDILYQGTELKDKTIGIIGLGIIGSKVARLAKAFGMNVIALKWSEKVLNNAIKMGITLVDLNVLLEISDYISLHVPLTDKTRNLIGIKELSIMKPNSVLINMSRGEVINEKELLYALENNLIGGAVLDVLENEPPKQDNPLFKLENIILSPALTFLPM
jgi:phosphoglycerate dehydrogenase-like enzyme